jgi:hypothetical protein
MKASGKQFGMFRWQRAVAAEIDGGAAEYSFEEFQTRPLFDALNGNGYHVLGQLNLTSPGLVVPNPAGTPLDVLQTPMGELDLFEPPQEVSIA